MFSMSTTAVCRLKVSGVMTTLHQLDQTERWLATRPVQLELSEAASRTSACDQQRGHDLVASGAPLRLRAVAPGSRPLGPATSTTSASTATDCAIAINAVATDCRRTGCWGEGEVGWRRSPQAGRPAVPAVITELDVACAGRHGLRTRMRMRRRARSTTTGIVWLQVSGPARSSLQAQRRGESALRLCASPAPGGLAT